MATEISKKFLVAKDLVVGFSPEKPINPKAWSIELDKSQLIGLVGPNGSGKTTLLRTLFGDVPALKGQVMLLGFQRSPIQFSPKEVSQTFSYLPQEAEYDGMQTVQEHVSLAFLPQLGWFGKMSPTHQAQLEEMLSYFNLTVLSSQRLDNLSTGEKQRVFLARVMLQQTTCMFLDEPTNHLDKETVSKCWNRLLEAKKENKLIVVASHDLEEVRKHCDQVIDLSR